MTDWGGQGPPLVLLHGGRRTGRSWDAVARRLRDSFRVLALDARGHGDSDTPPSGYADQDRVNDLAGVIEGLGLGSLFLMGHSLGGATSALYAARHAEKVRGVILIEPVADGPRHWVRVGSFSEDKTPRDRGRRNGWASLEELRQVLQRNPMTQAWTPEVLEDVLHGETRVHADGRVEMKWHAYAYNPEELRKDTFSLLAEAPRLTMPVLIMASAGNAHLQSDLEPIAGALPRGILVALPGLGHNIYMEAPDVVADYARRFLLEGDTRLLQPD
ncbi:MAG: alpha/beta hydrolase [Chloroflexi bacterium]|nr:alpha/beta hydrolase [Chloroflexota bacterium]